MAYRILVPQLGIKLTPPEVGVYNLKHWTAREIPFFKKKFL